MQGVMGRCSHDQVVSKETTSLKFICYGPDQQITCSCKESGRFEHAVPFHPSAGGEDVQADNKLTLDRPAPSSTADQETIFGAD